MMKKSKKSWLRLEAFRLAALVLQSNIEAGGITGYAESKGYTDEEREFLTGAMRGIITLLTPGNLDNHPDESPQDDEEPPPQAEERYLEDCDDLDGHPFGTPERQEHSPYTGT